MAKESGKDDVAEKSEAPVAEEKAKEVTTTKKKQRGLISRIWHGIFGSREDDVGMRLERISKEEATILSRMKRRSLTWGKRRRHLILLSVFLELIAVGYAIMTASSSRDWKNRAFRVLPMFLLPVLSYVTYTTLMKLINMREHKDKKTLERLQAERQFKIDELKEKTNYYLTQQLIQRYDTDPAAKAAAATVLASKLGADSGLKVYLEDEANKLRSATGKSNDAELVQQPGGLRNRKPQPNDHPDNGGSNPGLHHHDASVLQQMTAEIAEHSQPLYVDHYQQGKSDPYSGGFLARMAALLVGEDPTQCFALICGNCHMHNGLASKEDFPYVTYICPHCRAVNGSRKQDDRVPGIETSRDASSLTEDNVKATSTVDESSRENEQMASSPVDTDGADNAKISEEENGS